MRSRVAGVQSVTFRLKIGTQETAMPDVTLEDTEIFRKVSQEDIIVRTNVV